MWPLFLAISTNMNKNSFVLLSLLASQTFVTTIRVPFYQIKQAQIVRVSSEDLYSRVPDCLGSPPAFSI